ncbi:MAG TPA: ScyD/ScyE family protein [Prolixibacteraceae bacterium]|nr:ScyD/ScyE family protein [Prolixibacteraceae bacterium]
MKEIRIYSRALLLLFSLFLIGSCSKNNEVLNQDNQSLKKAVISAPLTPSVFAPNLVFPRGLKFGPDGYLYVALAGTGGSTLTDCIQVVAPLGPYLGGNTSSIVKISPSGDVSTVASNLPSDINTLQLTSGVSDVEFIGDQLYALLVAGCSHGNADYPSSVIKVNPDGTWAVIADLSTYYHNNPTAVIEPDDFEPDGTPYSMVNVRGDLYVVEPNHGELLKVTTSGKVSRVLDFSAHFGHIVPTAVGYHGNFYVGNLTVAPFVKGSANIFKVTPSGEVKIWESGFTTVLGVEFDKENRLYVLETSAGGDFIPGTGRVVRVNNDNSRDVIVDNLLFPTAMTFGPDGALYISNAGFGPPTGQILKVVLK